MAQHGGYRRPSNPAPVSGPGALSRRTDGGPSQPIRDLPNAKYGEGKAFREAQQAAPMTQGGGGPTGGVMPAGPDLSGIVPMDAGTQRPDEPLTAGMPGGPGAGPSGPPPGALDEASAERLRSYLPVLVFMASSPDASPATKQFVRQARAELG